MKKFLSLLLVFTMGALLVPPPAWAAATKADVYMALWAYRGVRMALTQVTDRESQEIIMKEVIKFGEKIKQVLDDAEKNPANDAETKARLSEFKSTWADFQKTRDEEIFPAIRSGNNQAARQLEQTVQLGRFRRLSLLVQPRGAPGAPAAQAPGTPAQRTVGTIEVTVPPSALAAPAAAPPPAATPPATGAK